MQGKLRPIRFDPDATHDSRLAIDEATFDAMHKAIASVWSTEAGVIQAREEHGAPYTDMRNRWDLLWLATYRGLIPCPRTKDSHIDTVLRRILPNSQED